MVKEVKLDIHRMPIPGNDIPLSTYRVQLSSEFTFNDLIKYADYFANLGVTHLYLSPILQATKNSTHCYDVINHEKINDDLGGEEAFKKMAKTFQRKGIGLVVDIVPNHMAIPVPIYLNHQLWDVLLKGEKSCYSHWFDVEWSKTGFSKIILPVLNDDISSIIENNEFQVDKMLLKDLYSKEKLTTRKVSSKKEIFVLKYQDNIFPILEGTQNLPIEELLQKQNYQLMHHSSGSDELNYRRFFDIGSLVGLKMEDEDVFYQTHKVIIKLVKQGFVKGLRIDHIDGLANPEQYLKRLRDATNGVWVVTEKILLPNEKIEKNWYTSGTTGYEALNYINNLQISSYGQNKLLDIYIKNIRLLNRSILKDKEMPLANLSNENMSSISKLISVSKRQIIRSGLYAETHRLVNVLYGLCKANIKTIDFSWRSIYDAVVELVVVFDRYRTYINVFDNKKSYSNETKNTINTAISESSDNLNDKSRKVLKVIEEILINDENTFFDVKNNFDNQKAIEKFIILFQQLTVSVFAKSVEDTVFYRYSPLISICDVGGEIGSFGITEHEFHSFCQKLQNTMPYTLTAIDTHDTKRSADSRAILSILSQFPDDWIKLIAKLKKTSEKYQTPYIDPNVENIFWQTVLSTYSLDSKDGGLIAYERISVFLIKCMREAKTHTSWTKINKQYEDEFLMFAKKVLEDEEINDIFKSFVHKHILAIQSAILTTKARHH